MYRPLCVLALLTLQAGLVHSFSWDIVASRNDRLEFYNEEKLTFTVTSRSLYDRDIQWITYDPIHNRVLFINSDTNSLLSFDIATGQIQTLITDFKPPLVFTSKIAYDPATGLLFALFGSNNKIYSYLVKPGSNHEVDGNLVIDLKGSSYEIDVDSCGYIYLSPTFGGSIMERARLNGSKREGVNIESSDGTKTALTIDSQAQKMYWVEYFSDHRGRHRSIVSVDLCGKNRRTLYNETVHSPTQLTVSKDFIYWATSKDSFFWKFPKNLPLSTVVEPKKIAFNDTSTDSDGRYNLLAANYAIEEQPRGIPLCKTLKRLLPNYSENNDSEGVAVVVSTDGSLLRVNETKVNGESRVSGDTCDNSVYQYYCSQGHCSTSAEGQPKCRCNAGYSGKRCEVNACQAYCFNAGACSLSEENNPVCQCTGDYQGERCDVPNFLIKCSQTASLLKDILNADLTSITEGKGVKSTCASTVV